MQTWVGNKYWRLIRWIINKQKKLWPRVRRREDDDDGENGCQGRKRWQEYVPQMIEVSGQQCKPTPPHSSTF
jgi:hypothetical protein